MTEQRVKNRGWVKNVAIIFLAVMLVLTFFSNTIMNASLPEAAVQYVQSGSITTQIRGTGTITAKEVYEVKTTTSRKVQSVLVTKEQEVKVGDVLLILAAGEGTETDELKTQLETAKYSYQQKLINMSGGGSEVTRAQEKLQEAIAARDAIAVNITAEDIELAKVRYETAKEYYQQLTYELEDAGGYVEGGKGDTLKELGDAVNAAQLEYDSNCIRYKNEKYYIEDILASEAARQLYKDKQACAEAIADVFTASEGSLIDYFVTYADSTFAERKALGLEFYIFDRNASYITNLPSQALAEIAKGYNAIREARDALTKAQDAYNKAVESMQPQNEALNKQVTEAKREMDALEAEHADMVEKKTAYDTAKDNVISCENALQTLLKTSQLDNLELSKLANEIAELEAKLEELSGGEKDAEGNVTGGQIVSEVNGVVKEINVTAGNNTDPATAVMTIEVPDRGYTVSMNVTNEQAQKVTIGDTAEISTGYWGSSGLSGKLVGIRNNTSAGQSGGKQLVFDVTGSDITSGTQVSVSIGQRSQNYDTIVPNSALRSDSNGSFVLVIVAKSSPLGNRFVATRVDVTELAKDDVNTAVSGGLSAYDMVLTTATKPVEDGMLVRLPD
uniref:HlyD family efflux transporter periplasmic adaptor subunit n=1 Tax=Candidatus Scatomorpha intestinigallinarum TaxID=2840923 RepID=UPI004026FAE2